MKHYQIKPSITDRSSVVVNLYLKEISKYPLLTQEEELALIKKIKENDLQARNKLVKSNLRFVISIAKQYQNKGIDLADLIEYGNIGLIKAAEKFDETRGFKFISYAVWWIRQSILQAISESSKVIRTPLNQCVAFSKINRFINKYEVEHGETPSPELIGEEFQIDPQKVREVILNNVSVFPIDPLVTDDSEEYVSDTMSSEITSDQELIQNSLKKDIQDIIQCLNPTEKDVLTKLFGINCTQCHIEDIADSLNITKERVRQIKDKAIMQIRKNPKLYSLTKYLG
jgi:RNA polymerase primary sigma factor